MFEEEISPEELFRQFFGGGMGGGAFGGPFGGFGTYRKSKENIYSATDRKINRRRQRLRLQHGRRARRPSTSNGRRRASKKTTQPRQPTSSLTSRRPARPSPPTAPLHRPPPLLHFLRQRPNLPLRALRQPAPAPNPAPRLVQTQSRLLRQPQRRHRLLVAQMERLGQLRGKPVCAAAVERV